MDQRAKVTMLDFKLHNETDTTKEYRYFKEGKGEPGLVSIDLLTGEASIIKLAPGDEFKWYAFKLTYSLEEMAANNSFTDTGTIMWY